MTQHEAIQSASLLERIRSGEVMGTDPASAMARDFALILRLYIREKVDNHFFESGYYQSTPTMSTSERVEIAIAGVHLAAEDVVQDIKQDAERAERTSV